MRGIPWTLWVGLLIVLLCEGMLFVDVRVSHRGAVHSQGEIDALRERGRPAGVVAKAARWVAVNMTALVWMGYLVFLEGVLTWQRGKSPIRARPHHFLLLCLASI